MDVSYEPLMKKLIRHVLRLFYQPHHCVIMDILLEKLLLKESEICGAMKMLSKEFNRLVLKLREDRLIKQESKIESTIDGKQLLQQVYYIDYKEIKDIIKYKIYKISKEIYTSYSNSKENISYICPKCTRTFSILEIQSYQVNYLFMCPDCDEELVERKSYEVDPHELQQHMVNDLKDVIDMLKQADNLKIPSMDYFKALEIKKMKETNKTAADVHDNKEEKDASRESIDKEFAEKDSMDECNYSLSDKHGGSPVDFSREEISFFNEEEIRLDTEMARPSSVQTAIESKDGMQDIFNETKKNDIIIKVAGRDVPFHDVTDDDKDKMTEEEYEAYFDVFMRMGS